MRQGTWTAVLVALAVVALIGGFLAGQNLTGSTGASEQRVEELTSQVERLNGQVSAFEERLATLENGTAAPGSSASGDFRIAYVDMFKVLQDLQGSELVKGALQQYRERQQEIQQQIEAIREQFQQGEITAKERDERIQELELQLQRLNLELSAPIQQKMIEVIRQIGEEKGYSLVIDNPASQYNAIVLYSQTGAADDITQEVVERLTQRLEEENAQETSGESNEGE